MKHLACRRGVHTALLILCMSLTSLACVVEQIDALIAERGVTYCPSSTGDEGETIDLSTGTSTSTTDAPASDGDADSQVSTETGETSAHGSEGSSSGGTGTPEPVCGDGVIQGEETCDDGNASPDDGCQDCARDSIIFVTSQLYQGFALGGLYGADQICRSLAAKAGLQRSETFRAWLSVPGESAADRLSHSRGRYKLVNGLVVAQSWDALTSGALQNPITVDENSQSQEQWAWTGTLVAGQPALGSEFCGEWDDDSGLLMFGGAGRSVATDDTWSFFDQDICQSANSLYCVEQ